MSTEVKAVEDTLKLVAGALILIAFLAAKREVGQPQPPGARGGHRAPSGFTSTATPQLTSRSSN